LDKLDKFREKFHNTFNFLSPSYTTRSSYQPES